MQRLFPNAREVEAEYYRRTSIFPIMHLVVLRRAIYERDRSIATALTKAFQTAKQQAYDRLEERLSPMPWMNLDLEYARQAMGADLLSYGVQMNLPTLEAATLNSYEQGLTERKLAVNELFAPETLELFSNG